MTDLLKTMCRAGEAFTTKAGKKVTYHLDGPNLRVERVKQRIREAHAGSVVWAAISTPAALAKAAHVSTDDVNGMLSKGLLRRSSETENGNWIIEGEIL